MKVPDLRAIAIAIAALIAGGVFGSVVIDQTDDGHGHKTKTVKVGVGKVQTAPQGDLEAPNPAPGDANAIPPAQSELRDETPAGVPHKVLQVGAEQTQELADVQVGPPQPTGGSQNYSCQRDFSGHVYSDYAAGSKQTEGVGHYTVSINLRGKGDVYGVRDYFKKTRVGSATFIIDFEANCLQMVPFGKKAWTQGNANSAACFSVEVVATGRETRAEWLAADLFKHRALAELFRDNLRRCGLPLKFVDPVGCTYPGGWTDHYHLECGNNHTDLAPACARSVMSNPTLAIAPFGVGCTGFPFDEFQRQLTQQDDATKRLLKGRRSHRILHAKLAAAIRCDRAKRKHCPTRTQRATWRASNRKLHQVFGKQLG